MRRHVKHSCKIANSDEGMEKLMEHTLKQQLAEQTKKVDTLQEQMKEITQLLKSQLNNPPAPQITNSTVINSAPVTTTINIVNIRSWNGNERLVIPTSIIKAAFTENPRLVEYCRMSDDERTDAGKAAPFVLEAIVDIVRRAHKDPISRNVYLNPKRADQALVSITDPESIEKPRWEVRPLMEVIRHLFDGVASALHRIIIADQERAQLPFDVQSAASWVPSLYGDEPERYVRDGRGPMSAHLANTAPFSALTTNTK